MFQELLQRVINILFKPMDEWRKIQGETWTIQNLFLRYAVILAAIPAVAGFIGHAVIGHSVMGISFRIPVGNAILWTVLQYALSLGSVFAVAFIMDALAPTFGAQKDLPTSFKVVVFSFTASWVGGIFHLVPTLSVLALLAGIYSLVLLYFGMKSIRNVPADKLVGYYVTTLIITIVVMAVVGFLVSAIALPSVGATASDMTSEMLRNMR